MSNSYKTALITGASSGIGETFSRALAQQGMSLVLVARSRQKLEALADQLRARHGVSVEVITADLSEEGAPSAVHRAVQERGVEIDWLVNNAGFATNGLFGTASSEQEHRQVMLNVTAVIDLTHAFLPSLLERKGVIINVASTAAFYPLAYQAVYGASKAFVLSFSEALWAENRERGLKVLVLCPGATDTGFFEAMGNDTLSQKDSPQAVVEEALRALSRGRHFTIPGTRNRFEALVIPRLLPRKNMASMVARLSQKFWINEPTTQHRAS